MAFRLEKGEPIKPGLIRLASKQLSLAADQLRTLEPDRERAIHKARRRCKRVRAVLRLLREPLGDEVYRELNGQVRDAAAVHSGARDADVLLATARSLSRSDAAWIPVTEELARRRREQYSPQTEQPASAEHSAGVLMEVRDRLQTLKLSGKGRRQLRNALKRDYRRARRRLPEPDTGLDTEAWHDWRKAVKAHGLQLDVIRTAMPAGIADRRRKVVRLGKTLGREHDMQVLAECLAASPEEFGTSVRHCRQVLTDRREREQAQARRWGKKLFAHRPGEMVKRLRLNRL